MLFRSAAPGNPVGAVQGEEKMSAQVMEREINLTEAVNPGKIIREVVTNRSMYYPGETIQGSIRFSDGDKTAGQAVSVLSKSGGLGTGTSRKSASNRTFLCPVCAGEGFYRLCAGGLLLSGWKTGGLYDDWGRCVLRLEYVSKVRLCDQDGLDRKSVV